jgi:hypothetical protein
MVFSGVAGSRPARELSLPDGYGKGTVKVSIAFSSKACLGLEPRGAWFA